MISCLAKRHALFLLLLFPLVVSCGTAIPDPGADVVGASPLATATSVPTSIPTPVPTRAPSQLVILHTNDNWGETEPCG